MTELELKEQIARIDRSITEAQNRQEESNTLRARDLECQEHGRKLRIESLNYEPESATLLLISGAAILGAGAVLGGVLARFHP